LLIASRPSVAVLICSSDARKDIVERVLPSVFKYWPDCPYPLFLGRNSHCEFGPKITTLVARPSEWRTECLEHVAQIDHTHLIVMLDDYLFLKPVDQRQLAMLVTRAIESNLAYLRLLPLGASIIERFRHIVRKPFPAEIRPIWKGRPFYSGLQIAIWNKAHFLSLLESPGTIWDFEHKAMNEIAHHAIIGSPPISYDHLVEKGRWLPYAPSLLRHAGLPSDLGERRVWSKWMTLRLFLDKLRFHVFGYVNH
jgi:hypothetical protein